MSIKKWPKKVVSIKFKNDLPKTVFVPDFMRFAQSTQLAHFFARLYFSVSFNND